MSLSDSRKITWDDLNELWLKNAGAWYEEKDVKEFIKETLKDMDNFRLGRDQLIFRFQARAGDKLIK